jgi:hypothetical protein
MVELCVKSFVFLSEDFFSHVRNEKHRTELGDPYRNLLPFLT